MNNLDLPSLTSIDCGGWNFEYTRWVTLESITNYERNDMM